MGAKRVTPVEIEKMYRLYKTMGNYAAVGRAVGRSPSTVAKYIKAGGMKNLSFTVANNVWEAFMPLIFLCPIPANDLTFKKIIKKF